MLGSKYQFAILYFERQDLELSLPAKKLDESVRNPISAEVAQSLLDELSDSTEALDASWKVRSRRNQERLSSGDPHQLLQVYRGLASIKLQKGSLNNSDRQQFNQSLELLTEELAIALGKPEEQVKMLLEQASNQSLSAA